MDNIELVLTGLQKRADLNGQTVHLLKEGHTKDRYAVSSKEIPDPILVKSTCLQTKNGLTFDVFLKSLAFLDNSNDTGLQNFAKLFRNGKFEEAASCAGKWSLKNMQPVFNEKNDEKTMKDEKDEKSLNEN